jgi:uncharacterized protein YndB with AHSA1/START domain
MARTETGSATSLEIRKTIAAPPAKVFRAWTDPKAVMRWFPQEGYEAAQTTIDLRPGGIYRWGLRKLPDGEPFFSTGRFIEIDAPRRLVCTWRWSSAPETKDDTVITIEFQDRGGSTEVVLRHDRFPDVNMRNQHEQGWTHCLAQLEDFINKEEKKR